MLVRWFRPAFSFSLLMAAASLAVSWSGVHALASQQSTLNDETTIQAALAGADTAWRNGDRSAAREEFERVVEAAHRLGVVRAEADAECGLAEVWFSLSVYPKAREHGLRALELYQRAPSAVGLGRANQVLGTTAELMGDYAEALTRARTAVDIFDRAGDRARRGGATLNLLRVDRSAANADEHVPLLARTVDDARATGNRRLEGEALHSWGDFLFVHERYEQSLEKLEQAAAAFEETKEFNGLGTVYNSLGRVYRAHGRLDEALRFQLKALALHERVALPRSLIQSLNAVGAVYQMIGRYARARTYYDRALAVAEQSGSPRIRDFLRANLANLQLDQGQFAGAAETLAQVIANQRDVYVAERYTSLAFALRRLGRLDEALTAANRGVELCIERERSCVYALDERAAAYTALRDYQAALRDVRRSLDNIEKLRTTLVPADLFKQDFQRQVDSVYGAAIALHFTQRQEREALETSELARSRAFLDLLASKDAQANEQRDADVAAPSAARSASTPPAGVGVTQLPSRTGESGNSSPDWSPGDLRSAINAAPAKIDDLVAVAARLKSSLVIYWSGDDELYIWVVEGNGRVSARRVPVLRAHLLELVRATSFLGTRAASVSSIAAQKTIPARDLTKLSVEAERARAWRELYNLLIAPVRTLLPRARGSLLTIVPHGPLHNLSFAALQDHSGRYLLEDYTLHYVPSVAMLQFTSSRRIPDARHGRLLLVADPALPPMSPLEPKLPRLPGARSEVRAIAQLVPRALVTELEADAASEARVRADAPGKAVVHFATHAIVHDEDPAGSYLVLGASGRDGSADGILSAREIYRLNLDADLIVLSACRSAGGRITGDGIATFARAFIYAGTPSLVASLWDVADEPVNRLIPAFYRSWFAGASKARSLRSAQLRFLNELRAGTVRVPTRAGIIVLSEDPLLWAGFVLIGESN